ncbi:MAG: ribosomal RNA small subunit methyltransferase A [Candidatus Staskawiczbacteria bacterium]|nr:ribosomal RNA small subunit methyltransferase A [Candidatus Staskawiczbacteria bacterium]
MELTSEKIIKEILLKYDIKPLKGLGQNFLIDRAILNKIVASAEPGPDDTVLEIGPGIGTLTQELAKTAKKVVAVEKDKKMCEILKETIKNSNVKIINGDILRLNNFKLISNFKFQISNYKVVANLPYYISSPVIRKFLEAEKQPELMVLMLQKEVAQRITAKPPRMSLLSVSVQFYARPEIISYVSKNSFWPAPKVDSAIIKITPQKPFKPASLGGSPTSPHLFFEVVKAGFSQPRKQLVNNLSKVLKLNKEEITAWLHKNNINPNQRAETLSVKDWINLSRNFK